VIVSNIRDTETHWVLEGPCGESCVLSKVNPSQLEIGLLGTRTSLVKNQKTLAMLWVAYPFSYVPRSTVPTSTFRPKLSRTNSTAIDILQHHSLLQISRRRS